MSSSGTPGTRATEKPLHRPRFEVLRNGLNRAAVGVPELIRDHVWRQPVLHEERRLSRMSDSVLGSQYALGARYQHPISNAWIVRLDAMHGWREGLKDVYGARVEIRRKL